ncbi:hypothetical protein [Blastococcus sp. TF02A-35]|uniref:hypothetical protein n=1 Tax=Blastococcus sp. TF02A-35 TaxID=2559612 RepID=UPI0010730A57|nr:hypothetical protein [Blastococcus sp. TF02A_35]TFV52122.1 hypothetical protein E4P43_07745 [Blastococcus sp. TF02A_35]
MTDPSQHDPPLPDDRTRDITLPPLPDRPPPALPKEWAGLRATADQPTTAVPAPAPAPPAAAQVPAAPPVPEVSKEEAVARIEARLLASQRTDELAAPPASARRERTLSFTSPEMRHRPVEQVQVGRTARRWPWVLLTLLPILVIVGAGIAWLLLLDGA